MQLMLAAAGAMTFSIFMIVPYVRSFIVNNYGYPDDNVMFLYLVGGAGSFLVVQFTGRAVDRLGSTPVATLGTILVTACLLVGFLPAHPIVPVMAVFTLYMSTASLRGVPISTLSSRIPAPHERAQFMSMQSATQHISSSIGAIGAAQILATDPVDHHLIHMPVAVATACLVSLTVPFLLWQVERRVRARVAATAATAQPVATVARNDDGAAEAAPIA
jgi:predicted MFS family arabinose efflux permease